MRPYISITLILCMFNIIFRFDLYTYMAIYNRKKQLQLIKMFWRTNDERMLKIFLIRVMISKFNYIIK